MAVIEMAEVGAEQRPLLVGLLTRSDILLSFARSLGAYEPGTQITIQLPAGRMVPLARALVVADELHVGVCSLLAVAAEQHTPRRAFLRLSTINPGPLLVRLKQEGIAYHSGEPDEEGEHLDYRTCPERACSLTHMQCSTILAHLILCVPSVCKP